MGMYMSQMWPPEPTLTESNLPSQTGKVFIVTGGYSGVGLALVKILYNAGGKVYIAGRSSSKAAQAIGSIQTDSDEHGGRLEFLELDLSDLSTIKPFVEAFIAKEQRLDGLWNNAAVSSCPPEMRTMQGLEMQMGTNAVGPYLLTELLQPLLRATAGNTPGGSVRVVWTGSIAVEGQAPRGGIDMDCLEKIPRDRYLNYALSKTANVLLCSAMGKQATKDGYQILHIVQNPGNLSTNLFRHMPWLLQTVAIPFLYDARYGAYTALWSGLSDNITLADHGSYVMPWGRKHPAFRPDIVEACKRGADDAFRQWCDKQVKEFR